MSFDTLKYYKEENYPEYKRVDGKNKPICEKCGKKVAEVKREVLITSFERRYFYVCSECNKED